MSVVNNLRVRRKALGITQIELANIVGMDQGLYSLMEAGHKIPRVDLAWKICRALDTTIEEMFPADNLLSQSSGVR